MANPSTILRVEDFSRSTLEAIAAQLDHSTTTEQLVYREAELDAVWSQIDMALRRAELANADPDEIHHLRRLLDAVWEAHNLVGGEDAARAAACLRAIIAHGWV